MRSRGRTWALLFLTYLTIFEVIQILWTAHVAFTSEAAVRALVVATTQTLALAVRDAVSAPVPALGRDALVYFFKTWVILALACSVATTSTELVFRRVDWTEAMLVALLFTPMMQAAVVTLQGDRAGPFLRQFRAVVRQPLARPPLWIDAALLTTSWILPDHPLIGASAGLLQQRWIGTKLVAAGGLCIASSLWAHNSSPGTRVRGAVLTIGVVLLASGIGRFAPWQDSLAALIPSFLAEQPSALLRLELSSFACTAIVLLALGARRGIAVHSADGAKVFGAGTVALAVAGLALAMNGFLSSQPVYPWAGIATTSESVAATLFLLGSLAAASSEHGHIDD